MRLSLRLSMIIGACVVFGAMSSQACSLAKSHPWFAKPKQLVKATAVILIGEAQEAEPVSNAGKRDYKLKVVEVLKGKFTDDHLRIPNVGPGADSDADEAAAKQLKDALNQSANLTSKDINRSKSNTRPEISYGPDCKLSVSGIEVGKHYLIFVDAFNPNAYRNIDADPAWLAEVKKLISSTEKKQK